ncbi:MAG: hypothetical protein AAB692_03570 [Patescibacteria group bacterium]
MRSHAALPLCILLVSCAGKSIPPKGKIPLYAPFAVPFKPPEIEQNPEVVVDEKGFSLTVPGKEWTYERESMVAGFGGQGYSIDVLLTQKKSTAQIAISSLSWASGTPALIALHNSDAIRKAAGMVNLIRVSPDGNTVSFDYKMQAQRGKVLVMRGKEYPEVTIVVFGGWSQREDAKMSPQMDAVVASVKTFKPKK